MSYPGIPDPFQAIRRIVSREIGERLDRLISIPGQMIDTARADLAAQMRELSAFLASMPHALANQITDSMRGPFSRPLNRAEQALVIEAFGQRVPPSLVHIVNGPGLSKVAAIALIKGNPAITIGRTFYVRPSRYTELGGDLSRTYGGIDMLLHEFTHVIQYETLGYARFGARYAAELQAHGYNADKLYDYDERDTTYATETLEGQAQMVGEYARARRRPNDPEAQRLIQQVRAKLQGTGIYAQ